MTTSSSAPFTLFDRGVWRRHRERAAHQNRVKFLHAEVTERLLDRLEGVRRSFATALDIGAHCGDLSRALAVRPGIEGVVVLEPAFGVLRHSGGLRVVGDPDLVPFCGRCFDLVISDLTLHWAADLPGALVQLRRVLMPGGLLLLAILGGATLIELRTALIEAEIAEQGGASPRVSPTVDLADAAALLQRAGFAAPVADADTITVSYPNIVALMHDLRGMGETNALTARQRGMLRRATLARAAAIYAERFGTEDGRIRATFEILYLTGWGPGGG